MAGAARAPGAGAGAGWAKTEDAGQAKATASTKDFENRMLSPHVVEDMLGADLPLG